jgi:hypothetical protein
VDTDIIRNLGGTRIVEDIQYFFLLVREATTKKSPLFVLFGKVICIIPWRKGLSSYVARHVVVIVSILH